MDETIFDLKKINFGVLLVVILMLTMVILPLPPFLLDLLFTFNIGLSLVILLVSIYVAKPLDFKMLDSVAARFHKIVTLEENNLPGGFGSAVAEYFIYKNYKNDLQFIGIPDKFVDHGTQEELHKLLGIDPDGIVETVKQFTQLNKNHEVHL